MKTRVWLVGALLLCGPAVLFGWNSAAGASAASKVVKGTFTFQSDFFGGGTSTVLEISQITYKGGLVGVAIDNGTSSSGSGGTFSGSGREYCAACTIAGKVGAFVATYTYSGSGNTYSGTLTFVQGFGKLAGLKGGGVFKGVISTNSNWYGYSYTLP